MWDFERQRKLNLETSAGSPGKSSLFFLTDVITLESDYPEIGLDGWESTSIFVVSGALPDGPWKSKGEIYLHTWSYS